MGTTASVDFKNKSSGNAKTKIKANKQTNKKTDQTSLRKGGDLDFSAYCFLQDSLLSFGICFSKQ